MTTTVSESTIAASTTGTATPLPATVLMSAVKTAAEPATAPPMGTTSTAAGGFTLPSNPFEANVDWSALAESLLNQIAQFFGRLLWAAAIVLVGWLVIALIVQPILRRIISNRQLDPILGQFVVIMVSSILKFFLISTAIGVLGVEQLSIAAFVAFFGVGVGQGVSGIMKDFIAGLILVVQKPIRHGDWVDASGADGEVIHVGLTHTTIRSSQRCHNIVPNSNITSNRIVNFNKEEIMRVHVELLVRHTEDLRLCREVFLEIAACDPRILPHPAPHFRVADIGSDGIKISCRPYVLKDDFWGVTFDLKAQLKWAFQRYGIQFQTSRLEVEMTPIVEPASIPPTAAPTRAGSFDSEFGGSVNDENDQACLAKMTLDEKWSRRNAMPTRRAEADAAGEDTGAVPMHRSIPEPPAELDDGEETDNIGDIDHYAPSSRATGYRVATVTRRDVLRLHALAARWEHYASDIDTATTQKLAHANVLHAAKNRWRRLRRKMLHKAHTSESTLDESKRLDRLKVHTKESLRGFGELQWVQKDQHDRDKRERYDNKKKEDAKRKKKKRALLATMNERATESALSKAKSEKRVRLVSHRSLEAAAHAALKQRRAESENLEDLAGSGDDDDDDDNNDKKQDDNHEEHREDVVVGGSGDGGNDDDDDDDDVNYDGEDVNGGDDFDSDADDNKRGAALITRYKSGREYMRERLKESAAGSQDDADDNATLTPVPREHVVNVNEADLATLDASLDVRMPSGQLVRMTTPRTQRKRPSVAKND